MTRSRMAILIVFSAALYVFLCWAFADGLFTEHWWDTDNIASSAILTYVFLAVIIGVGAYQVRRIPPAGIALAVPRSTAPGAVSDPASWQLLLGNTYLALLWMPIRFFVGREWLAAGEEKVRSDAWMDGGTALQGFWTNATATPEPPGRAAITYGWFRDFLQYMLDHQWYTWFAKLIAFGEVLIGFGLIVGALVGIAAFFGTVLNFNFQLAGSASTNPVLFGLGVLLVLGWKVAGHWGLDRWLLPILGTPWRPGRLVLSLPNQPKPAVPPAALE